MSPDMVTDWAGLLLIAAVPKSGRCCLPAWSELSAQAPTLPTSITNWNRRRRGLGPPHTRAGRRLHREVIIAIRRLEKPVVAAINGVGRRSRFQPAPGLRPAGGLQQLPVHHGLRQHRLHRRRGFYLYAARLVGAGKAMEIYMASQPIGAEYALELGLVNQVCPTDNFDRHALETATRLAQGPTVAYGRVKALFDRSWGNDLESQLAAETEAISNITATGDFQGGNQGLYSKAHPLVPGTLTTTARYDSPDRRALTVSPGRQRERNRERQRQRGRQREREGEPGQRRPAQQGTG